MLNVDIAYQKEMDYRTGIEASYISDQRFSKETLGKADTVVNFWLKNIEVFESLYKCRKFTDRRQTRWDSIYKGLITSPIFRDI